ncbi:group I truncated hemoglobin [Pseudocolwellia sp. HL-MZ19]|uniref:group I truncated hemoglobin n=1 Tax=unclassified Pseudocolwellia TaxID=2848178 RepID=UPI003CF1ADF3
MLKSICLIALLVISGCAAKQASLYETIGGQPKIDLIVDNFIEEIQYNESIFPYFANANVDRFREKITEHLCLVLEGPCEYTGDSMLLVHKGMNINETDFNTTVDLLINAMNKSNVTHPHQNKILNHLAKLREDIIYL